MKFEVWNCEKAKQICLVEILSRLGFEPVHHTKIDFWYLSPLHEENTAWLICWYRGPGQYPGDAVFMGARGLQGRG